jgi:hypothetical protein
MKVKLLVENTTESGKGGTTVADPQNIRREIPVASELCVFCRVVIGGKASIAPSTAKFRVAIYLQIHSSNSARKILREGTKFGILFVRRFSLK